MTEVLRGAWSSHHPEAPGSHRKSCLSSLLPHAHSTLACCCNHPGLSVEPALELHQRHLLAKTCYHIRRNNWKEEEHKELHDSMRNLNSLAREEVHSLEQTLGVHLQALDETLSKHDKGPNKQKSKTIQVVTSPNGSHTMAYPVIVHERLTTAITKAVSDKELRKSLSESLTFDNANTECKKLLTLLKVAVQTPSIGVASGATDINSDPGYSRAMDPDMTLHSSPGPDDTMDPDDSAGHSNWHSP
ncbi:hypothetical protein STEG23_019498 [Scotinomys teguina]